MPIKITIPATEQWNEETETFQTSDAVTLEFEHSLVSLSRWESKWHKPFLTNKEKSTEEVYGYIEAMCLDDEIPTETFYNMTKENIKQINDYIEDKMTATWFAENNKPGSREVMTNELIYHIVFALQMPIEVENWHLNRLITQIRVINEKNSPKKKMSPKEIAERNHRLNEERRNAMKTRG